MNADTSTAQLDHYEVITLRAENARLVAECEKLRTALQPFARQAELNELLDRGRFIVVLDDFRRAREALGGTS